MYYLIREKLEPFTDFSARDRSVPYVAALTEAEWTRESTVFDMGIELEIADQDRESTVAEVNYDSLTGAFSIPDRGDISGENNCFSFALDEKGIVFIDDSGTAERLIRRIAATKRWKMPSLERFLYDFLEQIVHNDQKILSLFEAELEEIEDAMLAESPDRYPRRINEIRGDIRELRIHYEQLMDLGQELEENENSFFKQENLRYFRLFNQRIALLHDIAASLRDYTIQLRDLYQAQLDVRQNHIMTLLTIVTAIFLPLSLIAGWYGMNFRYMPELESPAGYPVVIIVSVLIVVFSLIFFKKKRWL